MNKTKKTSSFAFFVRRFAPAAGLVGLGALLANVGTLALLTGRAYDYFFAPRASAIQVEIVDGTRQPLPAGTDVLVRVIDGNQREILARYVNSSSITVDNLEFHDNFQDLYTVIVWARGYKQAGFHPVRLQRGKTVPVFLMLRPERARLDFGAASWDKLKLRLPSLSAALSSGLSDREARERYERLMQEKPLVLAHLLNVGSVLERLELPSGKKIMPFYRQVLFDETLEQDKFFAYVDRRLVGELRAAVAAGVFEYAAGADVFHKGNTASFKETDFWEANVQITFYERDSRMVDGIELVRVDTDIDYYRDPAAHILLEVLPNTLGGKMTDPLEVYQLRWIASRSSRNVRGGLVFDPPYVIEKLS
ncbi:MAG: hypothetical protein IPM23_03505 [Candidatus Melainabacteria bacterium]|nr:hypothetical protein [Candidatus Melainabacteria bacterium]